MKPCASSRLIPGYGETSTTFQLGIQFTNTMPNFTKYLPVSKMTAYKPKFAVFKVKNKEEDHYQSLLSQDIIKGKKKIKFRRPLEAFGKNKHSIFSSSATSTSQQMESSRQNELVNELFMEVNIKLKTNFCAFLYVTYPSVPNYDLCHIHTELAVAAMLSYFHPYKEVQCYWLKDLQEKMNEILHNSAIIPKFGSPPISEEVKAILVLSVDAACLLRHENTCFLHSLCTAPSIRSQQVFIVEDLNLTVANHA